MINTSATELLAQIDLRQLFVFSNENPFLQLPLECPNQAVCEAIEAVGINYFMVGQLLFYGLLLLMIVFFVIAEFHWLKIIFMLIVRKSTKLERRKGYKRISLCLLVFVLSYIAWIFIFYTPWIKNLIESLV